MIAIKLLLPVLALAAPGLTPQTLESALSAEIARSTTSLKQEGYPAPYYLAVRVTDNYHHEARCALGGVRYDDSHRNLLATPDVRVGSNALDNHPVAPTERYVGRELPDLDDAGRIRHGLWLKLDEEYKQAAGGFLRKQALRVRRGKTEYDTDDLTREPALVRDAPIPEADFALGDAEALRRCAAVSGIFKMKKNLMGSYVEVNRQSTRNWLYDSAGARIHYAQSWAKLDLSAQAMTADGMRVSVARSFLAPEASRLPQPAALEATVREMVGDLDALQAASSTSSSWPSGRPR